MADPLRVGIVGFGLAGSLIHAPLIEATGDLRVTSVVTRDPNRAAHAGRRFPGAKIVKDVDALLSRTDEIDVVVVAAPNRHHESIALEAIEQRLAVVVDKPLALSVAAAERVRDAAAASNVTVGVFQNRRWDGDFLTVRQLLDSQRLGSVNRFESRLELWRPALDPAAWREEKDPSAGGGVLIDLGSHLIDQALQAFGPALSVHASALATRQHARVDDDVVVQLLHHGGVVSHIWVSFGTAWPGERFRISGTKGTFVKSGRDVQQDQLREGADPSSAEWGAEPPESWGVFADGERLERVPTLRGKWPSFYKGFAEAVRTGGTPPVSVESATATIRVLEAAREGAESGEVVHLRP